MVTYSVSSVYYQTPQSGRSLGWWNPPAVAASADDLTMMITSRYRHRPDLLSYDLYGTPRLWWLFAMINPDQIKDPIYDLVEGIQIRYPARSRLEGYLP